MLVKLENRQTDFADFRFADCRNNLNKVLMNRIMENLPGNSLPGWKRSKYGGTASIVDISLPKSRISKKQVFCNWIYNFMKMNNEITWSYYVALIFNQKLTGNAMKINWLDFSNWSNYNVRWLSKMWTAYLIYGDIFLQVILRIIGLINHPR